VLLSPDLKRTYPRFKAIPTNKMPIVVLILIPNSFKMNKVNPLFQLYLSCIVLFLLAFSSTDAVAKDYDFAINSYPKFFNKMSV
tara:strand:+ start:142 stop:393 length:252 start_codon:yes stop_codon:yes gene_type:complete